MRGNSKSTTYQARSRKRDRLAWLSCILVTLGCSGSKSNEQDPMTMAGTGGTGTGSGGGNAQPGMSSGGTGGNPAGGSGSGGSAAPKIDAGAHAAQTDGGVARSDASVDGSTPGGSAHGTGPGDWTAGDYPPDITSDNYLEISGVPGQGSNVRQYKVHVPPNYDPNTPTPLVFCIHGLGQDAVLFCVTGTAMNTKSDEAGFIMVMPNGYQNSWNAGTCCGAASSDMLDDVALFRAIFEEVGKHVNVDLDRVYATGLSNGGYMSYRLACDAADLFTAVAPGAGAVGTNDIGGGTNTMSDFTACEPSRPVSVLDIHGTSDPLIAYSLQALSLTQMAAKNGCATTTKPATQPASGGDTTCVTYDSCPTGIELTGCSIADGGHCWFGSPDCGTGGGDIGLAVVGNNSDTMKNTDAAWDFFRRLSR